MKVSVVSVCWNRALQTKRGLTSILNQEVLPDQMILVDDGSEDKGHTKEVARGLEELAKTKRVEFEYVYLNYPEARVSSYPRNVGLRKAKYEIVIFTEPECLHVGNTIKQMKEKIEADPMKIYVATQIWTMGQTIWNNLTEDEFLHPEKIIIHPYAQLTDATQPNNIKAPDSDWAITGSINCFAGCMIGTLREHFMECRGHDEEFVGYGYDDWDMINRIALYLNKLKNLEPSGIIPVNHENCNDIIVIHQWHTKNYPYNIYESAEKNGRKMADRIEKDNEHRANLNNDNWGKI
jgi:glycosyltransferase involved in cell wall biosynthesis